MEAYSILKDLAIIVIFAKIFGIAARKLKAPQVVGEIIAGLIIGPCVLGLVQQTDFITKRLLEAGVQPSISNTAFTSNISYELGDYILIDINAII